MHDGTLHPAETDDAAATDFEQATDRLRAGRDQPSAGDGKTGSVIGDQGGVPAAVKG